MIASLLLTMAAASCTPTGGSAENPADVLRKAGQAIGIDRLHGKVLRFESVTAAEQSFQSDRWYPPFFSAFNRETTWYDPRTGAERRTTETYYPGGTGRPFEVIVTGRSSWFVRDTIRQPVAPYHPIGSALRQLNPWAVLADWARAGDVRFLGRCQFRDYSRLVLARKTGLDEERLLIDPKTSFPVALLAERDHYLWGQTPVEAIWSNWREVGGTVYPGSAFSMVDGRTELSRTIGNVRLAPPDSAPALAVPDSSLTMAADAVPQFLQAAAPDTVRVGPTTFLLRNTGYTQAVTLVGDTVWVLDATQGEARARHDSTWIGRLFPGRHPIAVVVTDLAWPHIAGIRFWVARGATIVSHRASRQFLKQVIDRRWTRRPDLLERQRRKMIFRPVDADTRFAGGKLSLHPIDGIGSEGALMAWLPGDRFLWASDYIQQLGAPTQYLAEVLAAVDRAGLEPETFAAQHVGLTPWAKANALR